MGMEPSEYILDMSHLCVIMFELYIYQNLCSWGGFYWYNLTEEKNG